jgi:hypothetical protein
MPLRSSDEDARIILNSAKQNLYPQTRQLHCTSCCGEVIVMKVESNHDSLGILGKLAESLGTVLITIILYVFWAAEHEYEVC